jgi:hypothetical protein
MKEIASFCLISYNGPYSCICERRAVPPTAIHLSLSEECFMTGSPIGMGEQNQSERDKFENELKRILKAADESRIILRVIGSLAFQMHCPKFGYLQAAMGRAYTDIDFAAYGKQTKQIQELMTRLGYKENMEVFIVSEGQRAIHENPASGLHLDVFYERLDFCHAIHWAGRLEVDSPTIPLAELLLEKMQIVQINEKDIIDTIMLLLEHTLGDNDKETINIKRIAEICGGDWGFWRTVTMNLEKVRVLAQGYSQLASEQKSKVEAQVNEAMAHIEKEPKSLAWRLRARVGDRVKWYKDVDEVQ